MSRVFFSYQKRHTGVAEVRVLEGEDLKAGIGGTFDNGTVTTSINLTTTCGGKNQS